MASSINACFQVQKRCNFIINLVLLQAPVQDLGRGSWPNLRRLRLAQRNFLLSVLSSSCSPHLWPQRYPGGWGRGRGQCFYLLTLCFGEGTHAHQLSNSFFSTKKDYVLLKLPRSLGTIFMVQFHMGLYVPKNMINVHLERYENV